MAASDTAMGRVSDALRQAYALLESGGDPDAAEVLVLRPIVEAESQSGPHSAAYLDALNDLGRFYLLSGDMPHAVEAFRRAETVQPDDDAGRRTRIECVTHLGDALRAVGEFEDGEGVLRRALDERRAVYGSERPEYAAGLDALADALIADGSLADALPLVEEACLAYASAGHPRLLQAIARRADILAQVTVDIQRRGKAGGSQDQTVTPILFPPLPNLNAESAEVLVHSVMMRVEGGDPLVARRLSESLYPIVADTIGDDSDPALLVLAMAAEAERQLGVSGNPDVRCGALDAMLSAYDRRGDAVSALSIVQGLALAQSDAGDIDGARTSYLDAVRRADQMGTPSGRIWARRNYGLFLVETDDNAEAVRILQEAVAVHVPEDDAVAATAVVRAGIPLAILLRSQGQTAEAIALLDRAVQALPPDDPEAMAAKRRRDSLALQNATATAAGGAKR